MSLTTASLCIRVRSTRNNTVYSLLTVSIDYFKYNRTNGISSSTYDYFYNTYERSWCVEIKCERISTFLLLVHQAQDWKIMQVINNKIRDDVVKKFARFTKRVNGELIKGNKKKESIFTRKCISFLLMFSHV